MVENMKNTIISSTIFNWPRRGILLLVLAHMFISLPASAGTDPGLEYNVNYLFKMDMRGKIALVVPYRFYYEASASVNLKAYGAAGEGLDFCFGGIEATGYVMTTGGRTGTSLYFFTADSDPGRAGVFREKKLAAFRKGNPYYDRKIGKIRRRPMRVLSSEEGALRFHRGVRGIHSGVRLDMRLTESHSFTYSNIYKILGKLLLVFHHSFLPPGGLDKLEKTPHKIWFSEPLDFSGPLTRAARLMSEYAEKNADFRQDRRFRLKFHALFHPGNQLEICGEARPGVKVWKGMTVKYVSRKVRLRLTDDTLLEDTLFIDFWDDSGKGGEVRVSLNLRPRVEVPAVIVGNSQKKKSTSVSSCSRHEKAARSG